MEERHREEKGGDKNKGEKQKEEVVGRERRWQAGENENSDSDSAAELYFEFNQKTNPLLKERWVSLSSSLCSTATKDGNSRRRSFPSYQQHYCSLKMGYCLLPPPCSSALLDYILITPSTTVCQSSLGGSYYF